MRFSFLGGNMGGMKLKTYIAANDKRLEDIAADLARVLPKAPGIPTISRHVNRRRSPDWETMNAYKAITGGLVDFSDWEPLPKDGAATAARSAAHTD